MKKYLNSKSLIIYLVVFIVGITILIVHFWGGNIYEYFTFNDTNIIELEQGIYKVPKDNPDVFINYMCENGWKKVDRLGSICVFEKNTNIVEYSIRYKCCYALWEIQK